MTVNNYEKQEASRCLTRQIKLIQISETRVRTTPMCFLESTLQCTINLAIFWFLFRYCDALYTGSCLRITSHWHVLRLLMLFFTTGIELIVYDCLRNVFMLLVHLITYATTSAEKCLKPFKQILSQCCLVPRRYCVQTEYNFYCNSRRTCSTHSEGCINI